VPTYDRLLRFRNEYEDLEPGKRQAFLAALKEFIAVLQEWEDSGRQRRPVFPQHLGIKRLHGHEGIWEFAWAGDGRCTWSYGEPILAGKCHVVWRRVGSHAIYDDP
jgi:hypothetical protein